MDHHSLGAWALSVVAPVCALISCAVPQQAASQALRAQAGAYELEVLVNGVRAQTFEHAAETYVLGTEGSRYVLRVHNRSGRRIEAVVSVDGLDVIDGKPGDFASKRGYLVNAFGYVDIDGWRLSNREAAAFRFAPISESYAAKTGRARHVGVIGVAVFPERIERQPLPVYVPRAANPEREAQPSAADAPVHSRAASGAASPSKAERGDDALAGLDARAEAPASTQTAPRRSRTGLGTEFGEALYSQIQQVEFVRAHAGRPCALLGARYNDRAGLYALGIEVDARNEPLDLALRQSADPFPGSRRFARPPVDWRRD
jgi:hypothetical protein